MKFTAEKETLIKSVEWVSKTLSPRPIQPILSAIKIEATKEGVRFSSSDIENISETKELISVEKEGKVFVSGQLFTEVVRGLPNQKITIEKKENKIEISTDSTKYNLAVYKEEDLNTDIEENVKLGEVKTDVFFKAVSHVAVAAAREETTPMLTTIKISMEKEKMTLEAVDRFRIAKEIIDWKSSVDEEKTILIKAKTLSTISKIAEESENLEIFSAGHEDMKTVLKVGKNKIMIQMLSGEFPATEKLFKQIYKEEIIVNRKNIEEALSRIQIIAKTNPVVEIKIEKNLMKLSLTNDENEAIQEIPCEYGKGEIKVRFNINFLKDGISQFDDEKIKIFFEESTKTVRITAAKEQEKQIYLIVPVRE